MRFLPSKERRGFFTRLAETYGYEGPTEYVVYEGGAGKYYVISRDVERIPLEELRVSQGGLHVATEAGGGLRLTMDGAQLFGPHCTHEKLPLSDAQRDLWMEGEDVPYDGTERGFVILTWRSDILGCGRVTDGRIVNYVPKGRRIHEPHPS